MRVKEGSSVVVDAGEVGERPESGSTKREYNSGVTISKFSSDTFDLLPPSGLKILAVIRRIRRVKAARSQLALEEIRDIIFRGPCTKDIEKGTVVAVNADALQNVVEKPPGGANERDTLVLIVNRRSFPQDSKCGPRLKNGWDCFSH
jgi:hypothetical protein